MKAKDDYELDAKEISKGLHLISDSDLGFEEEILRYPYSLKPWLRYIKHKENGSFQEKIFVVQRACLDLPRSYKLWKLLLDLRISHIEPLDPINYKSEFEKVNQCFEHSLILLNKMPCVWEDYLRFLVRQSMPTKVRHTFDNALRALPITQHTRIWDIYLPYATHIGGETARKAYKRYIQISPQASERYVDLLVKLRLYEEAAQEYIKMIYDVKFQSSVGKSNFQMWLEMCDLFVRHSKSIKQVDIEKIIRSGISKFSDQRGRLWINLAAYWTSSGFLERSIDAFEEGVSTVMTIKDFTQTFDAYAEFMESIISAKMTAAAKSESEDIELELDMLMARFESLMEKRPLFINDVHLRQNPHNIVEWQNRVKLTCDNKEKVVNTYNDAFKTIKPKLVTGRYSCLWVDFAKYYEECGLIDTARIIFQKATNVPYKSVEELADVWREWAEMELRCKEYDKARKIMEMATIGPHHSKVDYRDETLTPQARLHKSIKVWSFYIDLEESFGTLDSTKKLYNQTIDLKIATPQILVNFANLLDENRYYEESFKVFERGTELFSYPAAFEIWNVYLTRFIKRYAGQQVERTRDLFEQSLRHCPPKFAKPLYLLYANYEEEHGLTRHAMRIYDRAAEAVEQIDKADIYRIYITKAASFLGLTATRPLYEKAIEQLPDTLACEFCLEFSGVERKLGEIDRSRSVLGYGAQFAGGNPAYWESWQKFEINHGNEETYKEMLRIQRSVDEIYKSDPSVIAIAKRIVAARANDNSSEGEYDSTELVDSDNDPMQRLESSLAAPSGFVAAANSQFEISNPTTVAKPSTIDLGQIDMDEF